MSKNATHNRAELKPSSGMAQLALAPADNGDQVDLAMIAQVLDTASRSLDEASWTKNAIALDHQGNEVDVVCGEAMAFCAQGAVLRASEVWTSVAFRTAMRFLHESSRVYTGDPTADLFTLNDDPSTTLDDIKSVLRLASCLAGQSEAQHSENSGATAPQAIDPGIEEPARERPSRQKRCHAHRRSLG